MDTDEARCRLEGRSPPERCRGRRQGGRINPVRSHFSRTIHLRPRQFHQSQLRPLALRHSGLRITQLRIAGHLRPVTNPALIALYPQGRITIESSDDFGKKVLAAAEDMKLSGRTMTLAAATAIIGGGPKPWHEIFDALLSKRLPFSVADRKRGVRAKSLMIGEEHLGILRRMSALMHATSIMTKWISKTDAGEILKATFDNLDALSDAGILSFEKADRMLRCDSESVLILASERMFRPEACLLTGISYQLMSRVARENGIAELHGGGWSRGEMMKFVTS